LSIFPLSLPLSQYGSVKPIFVLVLVRVGGLCNTSGGFNR
jgi:hypothetical protein